MTDTNTAHRPHRVIDNTLVVAAASRAADIHRFARTFRTEFGRNPSMEEIGREFGHTLDNLDEIAKILHGRYTNAFLDAMVGKGNYNIVPYPLRSLDDNDTYEAMISHLDDPKLSFAYVTDDKVMFIWLHDYPGWLEFCEPLGIRISASAKIAKRVTLFTRLAYLWAKVPVDELVIRPVVLDDHPELAELDPEYRDCFLDGANVISRELLEMMITNGSKAITNGYDREAINRRIDAAGSFSLRILTPWGLIKGDAICVPRSQMGGADVLYYEPTNCKSEVSSDGFVFCLAEPLSEPEDVWTDDQTLSWLGDWLFTQAELEAALADLCHRTVAKLAQGEVPSFFTHTASLDSGTSVDAFQRQALRWVRAGHDLTESIFLTDRVGTGFLNRLASRNLRMVGPEEEDMSDSTTRRKRRWPIRCALWAHVATDSWLKMAGYKLPPTPRGSVWYHEPTHRLVYNDLDFADLYERHGGWDLDDSVRAIFRTIDGQRKIIIVRSPNSIGEYDIKNHIDGEFAPQWETADGQMISFPELITDAEPPPYLEDLDISYKGLPQRDSSSSKFYSIDFVRKAIATALMSQGVFGRFANANMVYAATVGDYRREQLCSMEDAIDACTQKQTPAALLAIEDETERILRETIASGKPIDRTLWRARIGRLDPRGRYTYGLWTHLAQAHDLFVAHYAKQLREVAQAAVTHINPAIFDLGVLEYDVGKQLVEYYYRLSQLPRQKVTRRTGVREPETSGEFFNRINSYMMRLLNEVGSDARRYDYVLAMARHCYLVPHPNGSYADSAVFLSDGSGYATSVFGTYIEALEFYGVGTEEQFARTVTCPECHEQVVITERLEFQAFHHTGKCADCRQ